LPAPLVIVPLVGALGGLAAWGIAESVRVAALFTLVEIFGLGLILWVAFPGAGAIGTSLAAAVAPSEFGHWDGILLGGILAFYAYIGFEDMVNVAEEVRDPPRNMPIAIIVALAVSTLLYLAVAIVAIAGGGLEELARSNAPLALIYERSVSGSPVLISLIAMLAVVNGALIQIIMAARVGYGLARQGWIPSVFGSVHAKTRTPVLATAVVSALVLLMALLLPVEMLARVSSLLLLLVFAAINLALLRIQRRPADEHSGFRVPPWMPLGGFLSTVALLGYQSFAALSA